MWSFFKKRHLVLEHVRETVKRIDQSRPVADYDFVVLDTELTGLDAKKDEIVSIGAVKIRGLRVIFSDTFSCYVKPAQPLPKDSTLIHRITPQQLEQAPMLDDVLLDFVEFCGSALIVGHYIGLDMGFLNRSCKKNLGGNMQNPCIDTMRLAQVYKEEQWGNYYDQFNYKVSYNLNDLAEEHGLPGFTQHDALQDAIQTAYLFLFLVKKLKKGGILTLKDLYLAGKSWRWIF